MDLWIGDSHCVLPWVSLRWDIWTRKAWMSVSTGLYDCQYHHPN